MLCMAACRARGAAVYLVYPVYPLHPLHPLHPLYRSLSNLKLRKPRLLPVR